ncbi:MAG: Hpt domain-containing protein, partial [Proteobacteria bacterium]|nr:Hpt domain-containing protein [Pseudomonadota bacterium]MBU1610551.1 Hpt domain-containing protein [Pseudomonadota bacterium]
RPLHTIKGVTGFMSGFEQGSKFTHKVEDYLKAMQAGSIPTTEEHLALAGRAVNMVFQVLEQIRDMGAPEAEETATVLRLLEDAKPSAQVAAAATCIFFSSENVGDVVVISSDCPRVHTQADRTLLLNLLAVLPDGTRVLLDFSKMLTCSSSTWEDVLPHAERLDLSVAGLCPACRGVFLSWGFDRVILEYPDRESYLATPPPAERIDA